MKLAGLVLFSLPLLGQETGTRPNVVFILADDLGWGDLGAAGHPCIRTPNLDRLAAQGTMFSQFYVNGSVCSPTRAAFLTGHFPARHRIHGHLSTPEENEQRQMPNWLDSNATTLPDLLRAGGYATGHFGKWHLGRFNGAPPPSEYGFDQHRAHDSSGTPLGDESDPYYRMKSTEFIVDATLQFIRTVRNRPFYVNVWTLLPHAPLNPTPEQKIPYQSLNPDPSVFVGPFRRYLENAPQLKSQMQVYGASVTALDTAIGRLLDGLRDLGLVDNTLVFFTSDNGPEDYTLSGARNAGVGSPGPFRGRKRSLYEGGVRTPCVVRWPGRVPAGRVDRTSVLSGVDILPTICSLAGIPVRAAVKPDGEDVGDILRGRPRPRTKPLFWEWRFPILGDPSYHSPGLAIRDGGWKFLVQPDGSRPELYDLSVDPAEERNLAQHRADVTTRLSDRLRAWKKTLPLAKVFQQGVSPTTAYAGARDAYLSQSAHAANFGTASTVSVDGDTDGTGSDTRGLLRWSVADIPSLSTVQSATITLYVTNASAQTYEFYRLYRSWPEAEVTWDRARAGIPWQQPGAGGSQDRGQTVRGTVAASATGAVTVALNPAGIAMAQAWVNDPAGNHGILLEDAANPDGLGFASKEAAVAGQRPKLEIAYTPPATAVSAGEFSAAGGQDTTQAESCGALGMEAVLVLLIYSPLWRARISHRRSWRRSAAAVEAPSGALKRIEKTNVSPPGDSA